ncbi:hypothetical protein R6258_09550 [Halomonas sp. HP20-15]|uniref:hypothetical protein n=1 Tax=Halomonas sp. HP20-15 TaxID=3085901 RepID=UPI002980A7B7|nr:hypothetical protein [Halomonas sp. HP20-15]MDW5377157.1 hypothetical protein [Halomonas sp. HP20-15]
MKPTTYRTILALLTSLSLAACGYSGITVSHDNDRGDERTFTPADYALALSYDASLRQADDSSAGYFDNGSWRIAGGAPGERLITLSLADSNEITTGLWRLGASRNPKAVESCLTSPANAQTMPSTISIDGQPFHGFTLGDAGMSHFQRIEGYRAVVDGTCYAIDLIVQGTRGEVYDPPREAPYSQGEAIDRLRAITDGVAFSSG